ncbi:MAG: putative sulfate/molybdate transporter [Deltaproteobacteria bacterium]|nr:putative sulfate/molybdate transporter [Deltaproteobacteria bacterium]
MALGYRFDRLEFAGSLGDLGTLLPIAMGMILVNGLDACGLFFSIGLFYMASGFYFGVTVPVQPMKVIGAYSIAMGLTASQVAASGLLIAIFLLLIGATGMITLLGRFIPRSVIRGVQLSTGALLMAQGVRFIVGASPFQALKNAAEPFLVVQSLGPIPIGIVIGVMGGFLTLFLLENRRLPAGLVVVLAGLLLGVFLGTRAGFENLDIGLHFPEWLPFGVPEKADFTFALLILVVPQIPMTVGNAVMAYADLSTKYFGRESKRVTYRAACISMALGNFLSYVVGGMPLCHGAGGLAAHYRFGARTAGSNLMIGAVFLLLTILLGVHALSLVYLIPMSVLGILLLFAGAQLALTILDMKARKDLFVCLVMLGITLASNLAIGFMAGIAVAYLLKWDRLAV